MQGYVLTQSSIDDCCKNCSLCRQCQNSKSTRSGFHAENIIKAYAAGRVYIYMCKAGLVFWASLLFSKGRCYGALVAGRVLGMKREKAAKRLSMQSMLSPEAAYERLAAFPEKSAEEIKALAKLLSTCARRISEGKAPLQGQAGAAKISTEPYRAKALDTEKMLMAAMRRGDVNTGRKFLKELAALYFPAGNGRETPEELCRMKLRAIELATLLSRAALGPETTVDKAILDLNNRHLSRIREAKKAEELSGILYTLLDRTGGQLFSFKGMQHASALRKAERFIWENYTHKISLREIAQVSGLSATYFCTIFKEEMGENLSNRINRLRVEKAESMLGATRLSLDDIAGACGFEDTSWFSKTFKSYTGLSPGRYREQGKKEALFI
jgi:AraC-like DNA-binding protein/ligand-binding sensor protein